MNANLCLSTSCFECVCVMLLTYMGTVLYSLHILSLLLRLWVVFSNPGKLSNIQE